MLKSNTGVCGHSSLTKKKKEGTITSLVTIPSLIDLAHAEVIYLVKLGKSILFGAVRRLV